MWIIQAKTLPPAICLNVSFSGRSNLNIYKNQFQIVLWTKDSYFRITFGSKSNKKYNLNSKIDFVKWRSNFNKYIEIWSNIDNGLNFLCPWYRSFSTRKSFFIFLSITHQHKSLNHVRNFYFELAIIFDVCRNHFQIL